MSKRVNIAYKRKRKGKTDYRKRLQLLLSEQPRIVIRKSSKLMSVQLISYEQKGDRTIVGVSSKQLDKYQWKYGKNNIPACYLLGLLFGKKMIQAGHKEGVIDIGLYRSTKGSRLYAVMKGLIDAGVNISVGVSSVFHHLTTFINSSV